MEILVDMDMKCSQSEKNYLMNLAGLAESENSWERADKTSTNTEEDANVNESSKGNQTLSQVVRETLLSLGGSGSLHQIAEHIQTNYPQKASHKRWRSTLSGVLSTYYAKKEVTIQEAMMSDYTQKQNIIWTLDAPKGKISRSSSFNDKKTSKSSEYNSDDYNGSGNSLIELEKNGKLELSSGTWSPIPTPVSITPSASSENLSYYQRVVISLKALGGEGATYASICEYFARNWTKLTQEKKNWKQAIASELSHKFGRRIDKQEGVTLWTLNKDIQEKKPQLKPRKKRKTSQSSSRSGDSWKRQTQYSDSDIESPVIDEDRDVRSSPRSAKKVKRETPVKSKYVEDDSEHESSPDYSEHDEPATTKNEIIQSFKQTELTKWKPLIQNAMIVISRECTLEEIYIFLEDHQPQDVTQSRLWKGLVSSCLKTHFQSFQDYLGQTWWYLSQDETEAIAWPKDITYRHTLDWRSDDIQDDMENYTFCFDFMRSRPTEASPRGEIRTITLKHPAFIKGERECGYYLIESAKMGDFIGEYTGEVLRRSANSTGRHASLWSAPTFELEIDASTCGNEMRFINSVTKKGRTKSNAALVRMYDPASLLPCIGVFATSDIKSGSEVLLDTTYTNLLNANMKCFTMGESRINSKTKFVEDMDSKPSSDDEATQSD